MDKSYLEILAENDREAREGFDENAKDILADHNEYEETVGPIEHHHDEIENQDDFKKFGGSHQAAAGPAAPVARADTTKSSVLHEKDVRIHVINIDSRFRDDPTQLTTDFLYKFQRPMKNIVSARISSIEFPNTYYTFSTLRGNTSFTLSAVNVPGGTRNTPLADKIITIPDGNYDPMDLINTLNLLISGAFPNCTVKVDFNPNTGLINFSSPNQNFRLDFENGNYLSFLPRSFDRGLGYNLGFRVPNVGNTSQYTPNSTNNLCNPASPQNSPVTNACCCYQGTAVIDTIDNNYLFITLDHDWKVVINQAPDRSQHFSFCKIVMTVPKGSILYDNGANTLTKEYWFQQPSNIVSFPVRVSDPYDQTINLNGMDFSFTLELKEILNASLYETMRS
jgi:hypothetical protein